MNLRDISVIVTTFNETENVGRCLKNLDGFGEIVIVDSFSVDDTLDIARSHAATIFLRPYGSAAKQKNWAIDKVRNDWVLILDADEELTSDLKSEVEGIDNTDCRAGYWIRRRSHYLRRRIRHCGWQRDKVLRLFRRSLGRYEDKAVHEEVVLDGAAAVLKNKLNHYPYQRVEQHFHKINEYSGRGASDYLDCGGRAPLPNMILRPPFQFFRMYVLQGGLLDGVRGFILCLLSAYGVFLKYAKAWEMQRSRSG